MKTNKINPTKARVRGNIIPDWDALLKKTDFEDFHVTREKTNDITWNKQTYKAIRLNAHAEPVYLAVTVDNNIIVPEESVATITGRLTYHEATNNTYEVEPVPYQPISIYDDDRLISNLTTDANGEFSYEYTGNSGTHTIKIKSAHANGYNTKTSSLTIIVKYITKLEISPWYTFDLGFGEVKELVATLLDSDNQPIANKPIIFQEGYRSLGTATTDNNGKARIQYMESENRGTPTKIEIINNPTIYENVYSVFTGKITDEAGTPLANKNVALFHEYNGHMLEFGTSDSTGRFNIRYNPEIVDIPVHYYFAYRSNIADTTNNQYANYEPTFTALGDKITSERPEYMENISSDIITLRSDEKNNHWYINRSYNNNDNMSSATSKAPSIVAGNYDCGVNSNIHQSLPSGDNWIIRLTCEITGDARIVYNNAVDGNITLQNGVNGFKIYDNTQNYNTGTSVSPFTDNNVTVNTLYIIREGNKITFKYTSATGELVTYNRNYTNLSVVGSLYIRIADGSCILHELQMIETEELSNNIALPIYNMDNWAVISRGDGSTNPSLNDDTTIQMGIYDFHIWKQAIDTNKVYYVYFYKETPYYDLNIGICNSNNSIPTRAPNKAMNQSNAGVTGQSINKVKFYYDNSASKWFLMVNDDSQYTAELLDDNGNRYIHIQTTTTNTASQNKILAITEEDA